MQWADTYGNLEVEIEHYPIKFVSVEHDGSNKKTIMLQTDNKLVAKDDIDQKLVEAYQDGFDHGVSFCNI